MCVFAIVTGFLSYSFDTYVIRYTFRYEIGILGNVSIVMKVLKSKSTSLVHSLDIASR